MRRRARRGAAEVACPRRISRFVEPAMLLLLQREPMHGYGLMEGLQSVGFKEYPVDFSAVYRTLRRLEQSEMVSSDWDLEVSAGPPRRVYTITEAGRQHLATWVEELEATDKVLHTFLEAYETDLSA